jgi:FkbM family methyltransferase
MQPLRSLTRLVADVGGFLLALLGWSTETSARARRSIGFRFLRGQARTITFERDGLVWTVPPDDIVGLCLFLDGKFSLDALDPLLAWLAANTGFTSRSTIVDVGAHIGSACIPLVRRTSKRCLALEPVPETFRLLEQNVRSNGLAGAIDCRRVAIGTALGSVSMAVCVDGGMSEVSVPSGSEAFRRHAPWRGDVEAPMLPLDRAVEESGLGACDVALVWSDTQGYESEIIESGTSLWRRGVPLWVELWPEGLEAHGGVRRFLETSSHQFSGFIPAEDFVRLAADVTRIVRRPIADLATYTRQLLARPHPMDSPDTDILLVPESARPTSP